LSSSFICQDLITFAYATARKLSTSFNSLFQPEHYLHGAINTCYLNNSPPRRSPPSSLPSPPTSTGMAISCLLALGIMSPTKMANGGQPTVQLHIRRVALIVSTLAAQKQDVARSIAATMIIPRIHLALL